MYSVWHSYRYGDSINIMDEARMHIPKESLTRENRHKRISLPVIYYYLLYILPTDKKR